MADVAMGPLAVSVAETAKLLGVSKPTIYKLIHRGDFPVLRLGGRTLVAVDSLRDWVQQQTQTARTAT